MNNDDDDDDDDDGDDVTVTFFKSIKRLTFSEPQARPDLNDDDDDNAQWSKTVIFGHFRLQQKWSYLVINIFNGFIIMNYDIKK